MTLETGIMYKSLKSEQSCLVCRSIVKRHTYDVDSSVNELPTDLIQLYNVLECMVCKVQCILLITMYYNVLQTITAYDW